MDIKICGITNLEDAISACLSGADAIGFIFYRKSPRYVTPECVRDMIKRLPRNISKVGVFVNHDVRDVRETLSFCGLNMVQLHGDESSEYCLQFAPSMLIKAISPRSEDDPVLLQTFPVKAILLDASETGCYGGTGKQSNWDLGGRVKEKYPLILAGGLNINNVREAIKTVLPQAVDVNSGVEMFPGKKDPEKMKQIIETVHEAAGKPSVPVFIR